MSQPLVVSIPHRLGREEAVRRIKSGFSGTRSRYAAFFAVKEENWIGDRLAFDISTLGQRAHGTIEVTDDQVRLEVVLPWLIAKLAEKIAPAIRKEGRLLLEKK